MRKNGVARTFEPLGECAVLANGFTREKPAFSRLAPPGAVYCRPPAESAYITGGNLQKPYFHALSETAAKKDKAKAVLFLVENDYVTGVDLPVNGGFSVV